MTVDMVVANNLHHGIFVIFFSGSICRSSSLRMLSL